VAKKGGIIEGLLGDEEAGAADGDAAAGLDPIAAALATSAATRGRPLGLSLEAYLDQQRELVKIQTEHLHEQRMVLLSSLKIRRATDRLKFGMQLFFALAATVIGLGVLVMLYDAFTSRSVVVDAFKAPPALATRGLTGDVVAVGVLDALQKMQEATHASDRGLNTRGAWASDIKIEVPETGVSIGEINRMLHERFGHDLHIDGELVQTDTGGLALIVRGEGVPAATFTGGSGDLGKLTVQAAEYIYGRSQPRRYAAYLENENRNADAVAFLQRAFPRASSDEERARLANEWGNAYAGLFQPVPAFGKYRLAMALSKPGSKGWWAAWDNLTGSLAAIDEEAAWREGRALLQAAAAAPKREQPGLRTLINPAQATWDMPLELASYLDNAKLNGGAGASTILVAPQLADTYAWMHDPANAARYIAASDPDDPTTKAQALLLQGYAALDRGDAASAVAPLAAFYKAWAADPNLQYVYPNQACFTGLAYGLAGRLIEAEVVFKRVGVQSLCYALHGDVLVHAGDVAGADRIWAEGLKAGPDLPPVPLHRGLFELAQGDLKAAEADVSAAAAKAPHWADPWKAWGDVLAREGRWREALAKYDESLKYAPVWAELHQARDAAARHRS
jgi:hypothetical protein